jgi:hypothetical protein
MENELWHCKKCYSNIFPFTNIDNNKFEKLFDNKKKDLIIPNITDLSNTCSVCTKTLYNKNKGIPCNMCNALIHRKCTKLKVKELINLIKNDLPSWECSACIKLKFPFSDIPDCEIEEQTFNSNFNCICKTKNISSQNITKEIFNFSKMNFDTDKNFNIETDNNDIEDATQLSVDFSYYLTHDFHKLIQKQKSPKNISILHSNICSLRGNFDKLEQLIINLDHEFDVIALTETWNSNEKSHLFKPGLLEGYQPYDGLSGTTRKSGCGFYIRNGIKYISRKDISLSYYDDDNEYQIKWIEIVIKNKPNIITGVCYRHPRKNKNDTFITSMEAIFDKIKNENKLIVLSGDFNYNLLRHETDKTVNTFVNLMFGNSLQPCILQPTRYSNTNSPSLIDNIFINTVDKNIISGNILEKITDHMPNFLILSDIFGYGVKQKQKTRDFKNFNELHYIEDLQNANFINNTNPSESVNTNYKNFHDKFLKIIDTHAPYKTLSKKEIKQKQKPWITKAILKSIWHKNKYYSKFIKSQDNFWYHRYKYYRDMINSLIRKSKKQFYIKFFSNCKNKAKKVWSQINVIINKTKYKSKNEIYLNNNGEIVTDQKNVANMFNKYFTNVAQNLVDKMGETKNSFKDYLKNTNINSMFLEETTSDEVTKLINNIDVKKAEDIYGISPKLVKIAGPQISEALASIFNLSFEQGIFPDILKKAKIFPIHKADNKMVTSNYRPISILPICSKLLEKLMHCRLTNFLDKYKIIFEHQFGFQTKKSTEYAILDVYSKIIDSIEKKETPCCIFLDLAKAFDTVNHSILLDKLKHYGIRGFCLKWFESYLTNRPQCVQIGQQQSSFLDIKCGVPQGSVLGPLLFLLYINDICESSKLVDYQLFADDTSLFCSNKNPKILETNVNEALSEISEWLKANKLSLNVKKTNLMVFNLSKNDNVAKLNISINDEILETKKEAKYLGIFFDHKLLWDKHVDHINRKLIRGIGILCKLRHYLSTEMLKNVYNAFLQPHVDYGISAWASASNNQTKKITKITEKAVRIMNFKGRNEEALPLFQKFKILPPDLNKKLVDSIFIWKHCNDLLPTAIANIIKQNESSQQAINTNNNRFYIPYCRTSIAQRSIIYTGPKTWNNIVPKHLKEARSSGLFRKKLKTFLLN